MATATTDLLDALTQDVYIPGLHDYVNRDRPLWDFINTLPKKGFKGRKEIWAAQVGDNQSGGPLQEGESLPAPDYTEQINLEMELKYYYDAARMTAQAMELVDTPAAFASSVKVEMDSAMDGVIEPVYQNSLYGDGSGEIGQVLTYSGTTLTMVNQPTNGGIGNKLLRRKMRVSSYASKVRGVGPVHANYVTLGAISPAGATVVVPAAAGFVAGDYLFRATDAGRDPRELVTEGLGSIVDNAARKTTIYGKSRTTYPELSAMILENGGVLRAWTPELMNELGSYSNQNGGGKYPDVFVSQKSIVDRAAAYLALDRRATMDTMELKGGYKTVAWMIPNKGLVPWLHDKYARPNEIMGVHTKDLFWRIAEEFKPVKRDGRLWRYTDRADALEMWISDWRNLGSFGFNNHSAARDISHTA